MAEWEFVVIDQVPYGFHTTEFVDTGRGEVSNASRGIIVEHGGESAETKVVGNIVIVINLTKGIELSLEQGSDICVIRL